ncbi:UDP-N-acetylmuramoyl-L-alanyl-D-glutamate--2,6-diaminopimelate ligase [Bacillus spongiae]|uniref:UDP-N-acetylmuramoyl-L-alanyl-D-glutamate--2,6-diaminopimelate ligase n=1 Tax=Bacillus spongiae TaxID=2683610 RepID=A0ABU8H9V7_9BACI
MKLHILMGILPVYSLYGDGDPQINDLTDHHESVKQGDLFFCIKGEKLDGHDFAQQAVSMGAVAIIAEKRLNVNVPCVVVKNTRRAMAVMADYFFGQPTKQLCLVGITGTNGKTTTSLIIEKILDDAGKKTGLIGTLFSRIGGERGEETKVSNTTPNSLYLQKLFAKFRSQNATHAVMEVSSHALVQERVIGCDFDIALFTNLSQDHLDYHGTMNDYRDAKGLLFSRLGNSYNINYPKYAIVNGDDSHSSFYQKLTASHVLTYGIVEKADIMAKHIEMNEKGTRFLLITPFGEKKVMVPLVGEFNIYNVLAAVSVGLIQKIDLNQIISSIETFQGGNGRFQLINRGQKFMVIVDYAHTPDGLKNVLETAGKIAKGKIYVVIGCGGERDRQKRPQMGEIACHYADYAIFTSDNPRSENPQHIIKEMEKGTTKENFTSIVDRKKAIYHAIQQGIEGDVILIAGKGHEPYQIIGDKILEFNDVEVCHKALMKQAEND